MEQEAVGYERDIHPLFRKDVSSMSSTGYRVPTAAMALGLVLLTHSVPTSCWTGNRPRRATSDILRREG